MPAAVPMPDVDGSIARAVAAAFDAADPPPDCPLVAAAYVALSKDLRRQFAALLRAGVRVEPWFADGQPYPDSRALRADIVTNRRLSFFLGGYILPGHPLAADSGERLGLLRLAWNDILRVVHDFYGHALYGNPFGPRGELLAALFTETVGQTAWFFFGPAAHLPVRERPYPDQKAVLLPEDVRQF